MKRLFLAIGLLALTYSADAQVGVGTATPNASSVLELSSTTQGFLPPRMTAADRGAIVSPAKGLLVFQTDGAAGLYYNNGTAVLPDWRMVSTGSYSGLSLLYPTGTTYSCTIPLSAVGGLTIFDFNNGISNLNMTCTLPSPSAAGSGARIRFSYNRYNGSMNLTTTFVTPSGNIYPAMGPIGTSVTGLATSEFISDGTNWREVPAA